MKRPQHLICTGAWSDAALQALLDRANQLKYHPADTQIQQHLRGKTFMLFSFNPSLRTLTSFEAAVASLGGVPVYRNPDMLWLSQRPGEVGEALHDIAHIISSYCAGIGMRILLDKVPYYGYGHRLLQDFAQYSSVPVISMADDTYHPCQGLADVMTWSEAWSESGVGDVRHLQGKTLLVTWAKSRRIRPYSSVQSHILLASRLGMNVVVSRPDGYDLDPKVYQQARAYCAAHHRTFDVTNDPDAGYSGAHVVLARHWLSEDAYQDNALQSQSELQRSLAHEAWTVTQQRMQRTENAIFTNPMPIDRGYEAEEAVINGARSVLYAVAKNRLHVEKALLLQVT